MVVGVKHSHYGKASRITDQVQIVPDGAEVLRRRRHLRGGHQLLRGRRDGAVQLPLHEDPRLLRPAPRVGPLRLFALQPRPHPRPQGLAVDRVDVEGGSGGRVRDGFNVIWGSPSIFACNQEVPAGLYPDNQFILLEKRGKGAVPEEILLPHFRSALYMGKRNFKWPFDKFEWNILFNDALFD